MVRFFDQPIKTFILISGVIHIMLLGSLSLRPPFSTISSQEQLISVQLLEIVQLQEKPVRGIEQRKKNQASPTANQEAKKLPEPKAEAPTPLDQPPLLDSGPSLAKPGGLEIGQGQDGDATIAPGRGSGAGGDTGAGTGAGKGGLSGSQSPGKSGAGFREARPLQTVKASYPPMALRMGLEADVTLKILVDAEGKVVKAEIIKSAGMGFDEEALKAIRQFRFEPARKDGKNIPSESTYIYRFRLEK